MHEAPGSIPTTTHTQMTGLPGGHLIWTKLDIKVKTKQAALYSGTHF